MNWIKEAIVGINTPPFVDASLEIRAGESPDVLKHFTVFSAHGGTAQFRITQALFPRYVHFTLRKRGARTTLFIDSWFYKQVKPSDDYNLQQLAGVIL